MTLHWEAVPPAVAGAYRSISRALAGSDFFLAGGTALALQAGHRLSADLDLFSPSFDAVEQVLTALRRVEPALAVTLTAPRTLYVELHGVQASFFGTSYPALAPPVSSLPDLLPLAHPDDLAAMKLAAIASRGSRKDFTDLWLLITTRRTLAEYLARYQRKYAAFDLGHVVRSLAYFDDADAEPPLRLLIEAPWERIKSDFSAWVEDLVRQ
ncbi:MAG: nucleotidyl transferase AbiEii/AbiGii toxin family protein [Acidobacteriota bacterium]